MHHRVFRNLAVLALIILTGSRAQAQITAATITGTIKDDTGGILPGADVVARNTATGACRPSSSPSLSRPA
jgi:hypothetical protein